MPSWSNQALAHLLEIEDYLSAHSPATATTVVDRLVAAADDLDTFPLLGRMVPEFGDPEIRERIVAPYRLIYRVKNSRVEIIGIHHSKKKFPETL